MFEAQTRAEIISRLKKYYEAHKTGDASAVEGTFTFDTFAANAVEFARAYAEMELIVDAAFPQTSWGKYLDYLAEELAGLDRKAATPAKVVLQIAGTGGATVPAGSLFATAGKINFLSDESITIPETGIAEVKATAQLAGTSGNVAAGAIKKIPISIFGVSTVTNKQEAEGGYDEETDDDLLGRILFAVRQPATSGNVYHYILWATSVSGVGAVKVMPLWSGNGTVKVIVVDTDKENPSEELLKAVKTKIAENAPIGATVTVTAPSVVKIDISLKVTSGKGNTDALKSVIDSYFKDSVFSTDYTNIENLNQKMTVSLAQIGKIILEKAEETGVYDYSDLKLNQGTDNVIVSADGMPKVGTVTFA